MHGKHALVQVWNQIQSLWWCRMYSEGSREERRCRECEGTVQCEWNSKDEPAERKSEAVLWATARHVSQCGCHWERAHAGSVCAQRAERDVDESLGSAIQRSQTDYQFSARQREKGAESHSGTFLLIYISTFFLILFLSMMNYWIGIYKFQSEKYYQSQSSRLVEYLKLRLI